MPDYLFIRVPFAFLDYEKVGALVFLENLLILIFWAYVGAQGAILCRNAHARGQEKNNPLLPVMFLMMAIILGLVLSITLRDDKEQGFNNVGWGGNEIDAAYSKAVEMEPKNFRNRNPAVRQ